MAATQDRNAPRTAAADDWPPAANGRNRRVRGRGRGQGRGGGRNGRATPRLWALLNAQALLDGTTGIPGGVLPAEDDRRRLAARQAN